MCLFKYTIIVIIAALSSHACDGYNFNREDEQKDDKNAETDSNSVTEDPVDLFSGLSSTHDAEVNSTTSNSSSEHFQSSTTSGLENGPVNGNQYGIDFDLTHLMNMEQEMEMAQEMAQEKEQEMENEA